MATTCLCLVLPCLAAAATLTGTATGLTYTAAPGETNNLVITRSGASIIYTDAVGVPITATGTCTAIANVGTCPGAEVNDLRAFADNLNDSILADSSLGNIDFVFLVGGDGNDILTTQNLGDTQMNGDLDSPVTGGNDILTGGPGQDTMIPGGGNDTADAGTGDDRIIASDGIDSEIGGTGNDTFSEGVLPDGADTLSGGPGDDRIDSRNRSDDLTISFDGIANDGGSCPGAGCEGDNFLPDIEQIFSGIGNDNLTGSGGPDRLDGGDGNDTVNGLGGEDELSGESGDDVLSGGDAADSINGGLGSDQINGDGGDDQMNLELFDFATDTISGGAGFDEINGSSEEDSGTGDGIQVSLDGVANDGTRSTTVTPAFDNVEADVEDVTGTGGPDILVGSSRPNQLNGLGGADRITGGAGEDGLSGGRGDDTLNGGKGRDDFDAGGGKDRLLARDGKPDELRCGSALDRGKADRSDRLSPDCDKVKVPKKRKKR